jgi:hypothetical protein
MKTERYKISIEVRDDWGNLIVDEDGNKVTSISYDVDMLPENMELNLTRLGKQLKALMPNRIINLDASVHNTISGTFMTMYSYYVNKSRFVKH